MKYLVRRGVAVALTCAGFALLVQAGSVGLPSHGGGGGNNFNLDCGNDRVLIGVSGKKGEWLDRLRGECIKVTTDGTWLGTSSATAGAGGDGGNTFAVTCPRNTAIKGMNGRYGSFVNRLRLRCRPLGELGENSTVYASGSKPGGHSFNNQFCADGKPARGFHGKAGWYVNSVGLICHDGNTPAREALVAPNEVVVV